uniref:Cadherin domain-containing protein n=1 Tax=Amphilophus citrinellus TaxID=61819 RepID=A0A3Q0S566_AMPCI
FGSHFPTSKSNRHRQEKTLEISESVLPGVRIPLQPARDPDGGPFTIQQYKLGSNDHFRLEVKDKGEDGKIPILIVQQSLDREAAGSHSLVLTALDGGKPVKSGEMTILINVLDINDNAPVFSEDVYSVTLDENAPVGTIIVHVNATDLDDGPNGDVVYSFSSIVNSRLLKLFDINPTTGEITVKSHIDYEEKDKYEIEIQASDKGLAPLSTQKSVIVKIVDVNDNAPEIEVTSFSSSIPEDSRPGTTVALISVNDLDSGLNGKVICSIGKDVPFTLSPSLQDKMFSLVTKSPLDREKMVKYELTITAKDAGQPPLSSEKTISIVVSDVNDNSPEFSLSPYTFYVTEGNVPGASVFSVKASDNDENDNFSVQQYKLNHNEHFRLEVRDKGDDGKIPILVLQKALDREAARSHSLVLTALDGGKPPKSGNMNILVNVLDVNDNTAIFSKDLYSVMLYENAPVGTEVIQVNATDLDDGQNGEVVYSFGNSVSNNLFNLFGIDQSTGKITVKGLIDYEQKDKYEIEIQASDKSFAPLTTENSVIIEIVDVNDNAPEIELTSFSSSIPEDSRTGTTVALISVDDLDSGLNGKVICSIGKDVPFALTPSVQEKMFSLVTKSPLDREIQSQYELTITAKDAGEPSLSSEKTISVVVSDVNDNSPEFSLSPYTFYVTEGNDPGTSVFSVKASDHDENENARISYSILYKLSSNDHFRLEVKDSGDDGKIPVMIVQKPLDRETAGSHSLILTAVDGGKPPKSGNMNILVNVLDVNDNGPVFSKDFYSVMLDENAPIGTTVIQVNATDLDDGPNGDVVYSFSNSVNRKFFKFFEINPTTGEIIVKGLLDYEEKDRYEIEIQASDKGLPPMAAQKNVIIKISDLNDNAPKIEVTSFSSSIPEDSRPGTTVALISVNDLDSGVNGKVICSVNDDVPFILSPSLQDKMYSLVTKSPLDREKESQYMIIVVAKDAGQPSLSSENTISVVVSDVNDNSPETNVCAVYSSRTESRVLCVDEILALVCWPPGKGVIC